MGRKRRKLCVKHFRMSVYLDSWKSLLFKCTSHLKDTGVAQNMPQNNTPWETKREAEKERRERMKETGNVWKKNKNKIKGALPDVNLKNSWTFFPVKNVGCSIEDFYKNSIVLKRFKDYYDKLDTAGFMNLLMLFFKSKVVPAGAESAHHLPQSDTDSLFFS